MDYKKTYNKDYFNGKNSFFYSLGYGNFSYLYFNTLFRHIKKYVKPGNVLDIGCAYGLMLQRFPNNTKKFGIDVSKHAISVAKKNLPRARLLTHNIEDKIPFPQNYFDLIICNDVLEHIEKPELALKNIIRVLKKGGVLYITSPNLNKLRKLIFAKADKLEHHISMKSHKEYLKMFKSHKLKVLKNWTCFDIVESIKIKGNIGLESRFILKK